MIRVKKYINKLKILALLTLFMTSALNTLFPYLVHAAPAGVCDDTTVKVFVTPTFSGRDICSTYYTDMKGKFIAPSLWAWPSTYGGTNDATGFINFMQTELNLCGNPYVDSNCPSQFERYQVIGNSVIINYMLGRDPTSFGGSPAAGVLAAQADLNSSTSVWKATINNYQTAGLVQWQTTIAGNDPSFDNCNLFADPESHGRTDTYVILKGGVTDMYAYCNEMDEAPDSFGYDPPPRPTDDFIIFENPDGTFFRINRRCGNLTGAFSPIVGQFANTPRASVDNVDLAAPINADFHSWVDSNIVGASQVNNIQIRREFYTLTGAGVRTNLGGTPSVITVSLTNTSNQFRLDLTLNVSGLNPGDKICAATTVTPGDGTVDASGNYLNPPGAPAEQTTCLTLHNKPYLGIFGGDVFAGGGFDSGCTPTNGVIDTVVSGVPARGSGSQLAAFALGTINGFNSAQLRSGGPVPNPPDGLYFANSGGLSGSFGGNHCITDYPFPATAPPGSVANNTDNFMDITFIPTGTYYFTPPPGYAVICSSILNGTQQTIKVGTHITIYVKGDVYIVPCFLPRDTGDYVYETSWNSAAAIPSLTIIADGNIYINDTVTQLDGNFIARPVLGDPSSGTINTCVDMATYHNFTKTDVIDSTKTDYYQASCNKQLVVNGSFVARHIDWLRTYGDTSRASLGENPYNSPPRLCEVGLPATRTCAAEVIINGPETYIGSTPLSDFDQKFDYFTSLPPIL